MTVSVLSAAKRLGMTSGWVLTNLHMQKMCYLAHMFYLGREEKPLVDGHFEAWNFGPVHPVLYQALKQFGGQPVKKFALKDHPDIPDDHPGIPYLDEAVTELPRNKLVAITHWSKGAWSKNYDPVWTGMRISNSDIRDEYLERMGHDEKARAG